MVQFSFDRVKIVVGKGENAVYQHFLLFPQCFQSFLSQHWENPGQFQNGELFSKRFHAFNIPTVRAF